MGLMPRSVLRVCNCVEHHALGGAQRASQFFGTWDGLESLASFGGTNSRIYGCIFGEFQRYSLSRSSDGFSLRVAS
jgi:hypothetical protein